jgi:hypothetical protein
MMLSRRVDSTSLFRHLLIACALLGFYLDVLPTPTPGVATSDLASSGGKSPLAPRPDDAERDETPDETGDLTWPQVKLVARARTIRPWVRSLWSFSAALTELGRVGLVGPCNLPHGPRDSRDIGSSVALSSLLCRLIC